MFDEISTKPSILQQHENIQIRDTIDLLVFVPCTKERNETTSAYLRLRSLRLVACYNHRHIPMSECVPGRVSLQTPNPNRKALAYATNDRSASYLRSRCLDAVSFTRGLNPHRRVADYNEIDINLRQHDATGTNMREESTCSKIM